jgi:Zn-dependent M28 family amino/carboxypeptidase
MRARLGTTIGVVISAALLVASVGCRSAADRFAELDGPLVPNVVFPDDFGIDVSDLSVPVKPLIDAVSIARLRAHVGAIDGPRPGNSVAGNAAADYVETTLENSGYTVTRQPVTTGGVTMPNVIASKPGTAICADKVFVVGAHYDSVSSTPGADDDASGVAGMLEIAHVLRNVTLPISVQFVGFALEETGLNGSRVMATDLRQRNVDVVGMVSLEMIGFTKPGNDQFIGSTNDYLGMVGNPASEYLARVFGAAAFEYLPFYFAPASVIDPAVLSDILRSDHASFWAQNYQALLLTDTANFRNPNYHQSTDTIDTLNFSFMRGAVRTTIAGLVALATVDAVNNGQPDICA